MSTFYLIIAFLWTAGVLALALTPPKESAWLFDTFGDKVLHAFAFSVGCFAWGKASESVAFMRRFAPFIGALIALIVGILIEVFQQYTPGRHSDRADVVADLIGILPALLILLWTRTRSRPRAAGSPS